MTENNPTVASKEALKIQALTERIASLVAQYEDGMADLRAEATMTINSLVARVQELEGAQADVAQEASAEEQG